MATVKRRSSTLPAVSQSAIAQASVMLQALPEKPRDNWSLREAVSLLHDSIITAIDRGYSHEEVAAMLGEKGVDITVPSLKRYLTSVKREKESSKPKSNRGGRRSKSASFESVTLAERETPRKSAPSIALPIEKPTEKPSAASKAASQASAKKTAEPSARTKAASRSGGRSSKQKGNSK